METVLDSVSGLFVRPGTQDVRIVLGERGSYRKRLDAPHVPRSERSLLDLGANIGGVSCLAVDELGYSRAVAVEPDPDNLMLLRANASERPGVVVVAGAVHSVKGLTTLYAAGERRGAFSTTNPHNARSGRYEPVSVETFLLPDLLARWRPSVVKCDVEGGEYPIAGWLPRMPEVVRRLIIEIHLWPGDAMRAQGRSLYDMMQRKGWIEPPGLRPIRLRTLDPLAREAWWATATNGLFTFDR